MGEGSGRWGEEGGARPTKSFSAPSKNLRQVILPPQKKMKSRYNLQLFFFAGKNGPVFSSVD